MAFSVNIYEGRWPWSRTGSGSTRRPAAEAHGVHNFLPQESVVISDRTRCANKLGEGSFAKVYRGEYNGKPCAVKVFKEDKMKKELSPDTGGTSEVELLSKVQHTNIVQMYGIWFDPYKNRAEPSIVMELCDESLYNFIRRYKGKIVPKEKKLLILQDIASGMVYLHGQNIVHGDLHSSNVLLCHSEDQTVAKIADFDMARFLDTGTQHHFTVRFTAEEYLPPEVFDHKEHKDQRKKWARLTPKVDVFCFGEIVLEMGCETYPTPTAKCQGREMLTELQRREKHLLKLKQSDKESLGSIIRKCLADAPEGRPSFTEILLEVEGYLHMYGERPDLEVLQDKTAECEALHAEALKWEGEAKSLSSMQDVLETEIEKERAEIEKEKAEKKDLQEQLLLTQKRVDELDERLQSMATEKEEIMKQATTAEKHNAQMEEDLSNASTQLEEMIKQKELAQISYKAELDKKSGEAEELHAKCSELKNSLDGLQEKTLKLQGELAENKRASEADRNELVAAKVLRLLAEKERDEQAEKYHEADQLICRLKQEAEVTREDLQNIKEENAELRRQLGVVVENQHELEALRLKCSSAVAEKTRAEEKLLAASKDMAKLEEEAGEAKRQLREAEEEIHIVKKQRDDFADKLESRAAIDKKLEEYKAELEKQLKELQERNAHLHGQLTENHRVEAINRNELEAARQHRFAAEEGKKEADALLVEAKQKACHQVGSLTDELGKAKGQLSELKEECSTLQDTVSQLQKENDSLQQKCSELGDVKAKLQACQRFAEELLEAGRYEHRGKPSASKELIMQNLCTQDEEGSPENLQEKAQFNPMIKFLKMDALPLLTPSVGSGEDVASTTVLTQEAAQKLQLLERERDSLKVERHMYQMKWLATEDMLQTVKDDRQSIQDERDSLLCIKDTLEQEKKDMMAKQTGLQEELNVKQEDLEKTKEKTLKLQGELTENQRASEADRNELVAAKVQRQSAEKERDEQTEKCLQACKQRETFRNEAEEVKKELKTLKEERSTLQHKVSVLETDNASLQERFSDIEDDKDKLQASLEDSNEWIMHHLCTPDKEGSTKQLLEKTEFHAMMELFKEYYEKASKRAEQAAEENQRLLASTDGLKEKMQELTHASQALQKELYEKQQRLDEQQREITALTEKLSSLQNTKVVHVPLASDVVDVTADEALLQQLCYMATGIKQLLVSPDGGTFKLGSGDASLEFPPGAIVEETSVRYAIILHGPFVFPAGSKPGSVIIYLNMDGATLLKPVLLYLSHWCIKEKGEDEDTLKFVSASHTLEAGQQAYVFEEEDDGDFTRTNVGVLSIRDPHCLYCVETERETVAMYSAIAFSRYIPSEKTLLFRIQLMCDSREWNEKLTTTLQLKNWEKASDGDVVTRFQYADGQHQITASPKGMAGPGWEAAIYGQQGVMDQMFSRPLQKSEDEVEQEVISGRFPPCILYKIIYSSPEEKRTRPALLKVDLNGADVPLFFSCRIKEMSSYGPSLATSGHIPSAERRPSSPQAEISQPAEVIGALKHELDARWREFGTYLHVEPAIMDSIDGDNKSHVGACMLHLVENWLAHDNNGTGDLPRTWDTVVQAVKKTGKGRLAEELAQRYGVRLSGQ